MPGASTGALAARLPGKLTSPSEAAIRAEREVRLQEALNRMDPLDREILVLRHYGQMTNGAAALELEKSRRAGATPGPWSGSRRSWPPCRARAPRGKDE